MFTVLSSLVVNRTADAIELSNGITVEVRAAPFRRLCGVTCVAVIASEAAFWLDETSANADVEIFNAGKYETAAALLGDRILLVPGTDFSRFLLASALGHLGEGDEARRIWRELEEINPKYSLREHFTRQPFKQETSNGLPRSREGGIVDLKADEFQKINTLISWTTVPKTKVQA